MTSFKTLTQLARLVAILTAGVFLFAADGALARNGGHSNDGGRMKTSGLNSGRDLNRDRNRGNADKMKSADSNRDRGRGSKYSQKSKDNGKVENKVSEKSKGKNADQVSEKTKGKDKDKVVGATTTPPIVKDANPAKVSAQAAGGGATTVAPTSSNPSAGGIATLSSGVTKANSPASTAGVNPPVRSGGTVYVDKSSITITGKDVGKRYIQAFGGGVAYTIAPYAGTAVAAYGLAKGGVVGAYKEVKSAVKSVGRVFWWW